MAKDMSMNVQNTTVQTQMSINEQINGYTNGGTSIQRNIIQL